MSSIWILIRSYMDRFYFPHITFSDILDIIIISYLIYHVLVWIQTSRAFTLLKGIVMVILFLAISYILRLNTILWVAKNLVNVFLLAIIILFQPEFRRALDEIGRKQFLRGIFENSRKASEQRLSDKTIYELVKTATELSKARTGALIVIEHDTPLGEYENTGIRIDAIVTEQLLVNIFEKNTPLHDGAVIIRNNRVVAATCYLPLTERQDVNKDLGTRHRAGLGISEVTDSMTLIVSEETGGISIAYEGTLYQELDEDSLRRQLTKLQDPVEKGVKGKKRRKGGRKDEEKETA